ncbi:MAG: hypothetical protein A2066_07035 [Bacteroidetes bacterium GWB2_41_8]|nr:MAG: hypothetical protein A2066_07035 [Bacteroidetes bacterium GWB2_41_8]
MITESWFGSFPHEEKIKTIGMASNRRVSFIIIFSSETFLSLTGSKIKYKIPYICNNQKRPNYETYFNSGGLLFRNFLISCNKKADSISITQFFHFSINSFLS